MRIDENFGRTLVLFAEDGGDPAVDEATIDYITGRWSARAGRQLLPFGRFNSHFATDPLTMEPGETKEMAILGEVTSDWFALSAEALGAVESFTSADGGGRPTAWNVEVAHDPTPSVEFALRYEVGRDLPESVERRYVAVASWSPQEHVSITVEFLRAESGEGGGEENVVTARLALEF